LIPEFRVGKLVSRSEDGGGVVKKDSGVGKGVSLELSELEDLVSMDDCEILVEDGCEVEE